MSQKKEFVLKSFGKPQNFRALCKEYGISTKTGYKWKSRFLEDGMGGLEEQSRRPLSHARGLSEAVICEIVRIKQQHRFWGARKVRDVYARRHDDLPSESSLSVFWSALGWWSTGAYADKAKRDGSARDA